MSENIHVSPTPIQRNDRDVAVELTQLYYSRFAFESADEIANTYIKFYASAKITESLYGKNLAEFTEKELKEKYNNQKQ